MKTLLSVLLLTAVTSTAQTGLIAHKSHSGTNATFAFSDPGNFGGPPIYFERQLNPTVTSLRWLNDTVVIQKTDMFGTDREDTLYNHPIYSDPNIPLDSIRNTQAVPIQLIDTMNRYRNEAPAKSNKGKKTVTPKSTPATKGTERKKKSILWLLIIGGGMFTGLMLTGRKKKTLRYQL